MRNSSLRTYRLPPLNGQAIRIGTSEGEAVRLLIANIGGGDAFVGFEPAELNLIGSGVNNGNFFQITPGMSPVIVLSPKLILAAIGTTANVIISVAQSEAFPVRFNQVDDYRRYQR